MVEEEQGVICALKKKLGSPFSFHHHFIKTLEYVMLLYFLKMVLCIILKCCCASF